MPAVVYRDGRYYDLRHRVQINTINTMFGNNHDLRMNLLLVERSHKHYPRSDKSQPRRKILLNDSIFLVHFFCTRSVIRYSEDVCCYCMYRQLPETVGEHLRETRVT